MTPRQKPILSLALLFPLSLLPTAAHPNENPSAQEIVAASVAASGGAKLEAIQTVRRQAAMHLEGNMFGTLDGSWEIAFEPGKRGFQQTVFAGTASTIAWDGTSAWSESAAGTRPLNPWELALNRWLWELSYLHALARDQRLSSLRRVGEESIDDRNHYVLEQVDENGTATRIFVDAETWLISRLASSIDIPTLGLCQVTTDYSDYRETEGALLPYRASQVFENLWTYEAEFTDTEINPKLQEDLFLEP